jgi:hypothetical protein
MKIEKAFDSELKEIDVTALDGIAGGYLADFQNVSDFPAWLLPYINIAHVAQVAQVFATR